MNVTIKTNEVSFIETRMEIQMANMESVAVEKTAF